MNSVSQERLDAEANIRAEKQRRQARRDMFAAAALTGLCAESISERHTDEFIVETARGLADALINELDDSEDE